MLSSRVILRCPRATPAGVAFALLPGILAASLLAGCGSSAPLRPREGPPGPAMLRVDPGTYDGQPARRIASAHYVIETTIEDEDFTQSLGQLMEGALAEYQRLAPGVPLSGSPMYCHIFATRMQWAGYTRRNAGDDADIYLQINRGGYTAGDRYVAYFIGDIGTWSVAAHEGFHQYVARHFKRRPPPFLEEGLACMFEDVSWRGGLPAWDLSHNAARDSGLRKTVARNLLMPLDQLCTMHAGQVVNTSAARIEGFYAESWAFARFLWDAQGGRYRPALQRMLRDLATGQAPGVAGGADPAAAWDPRSAKPLLEHYLGSDLGSVDREFRAYVSQLVGRRGNSGADD